MLIYFGCTTIEDIFRKHSFTTCEKRQKENDVRLAHAYGVKSKFLHCTYLLKFCQFSSNFTSTLLRHELILDSQDEG